MNDLTHMTLADARDALKAKKITAVELTDAHVAAVSAAAPLNAYVLETPDHARAMAAQSDKKIAAGTAGPLEGIPLGIKDLYATKGVRTTACSNILGNFVPDYESTVTSNLWRDGAVMLGKLNNDEFAMGSSNETSSGSGRLVRRLRIRGCGRPVPWRNGHRYGRFDPPACGVHRHGRHQADLWALLALGNCRLRILA